MQIYISKNKQQHGPFDEAQVWEMLQRGQLSPSDLGIRHGEKQWHPLGVLFPNFNLAGTPLSGPNVYPSTLETGKKRRRTGFGVFLLVIGILVFLGGATTAVLRPTSFRSFCENDQARRLSEVKQAKEKFDLNKTNENFEDFEIKMESLRSWAKHCDKSAANYRFWTAISILTAIAGFLMMLTGFFWRR